MGELVQSKIQFPADSASDNAANTDFFRPSQPQLLPTQSQPSTSIQVKLPLEIQVEVDVDPQKYLVDELIRQKPSLDLMASLIRGIPTEPGRYSAINTQQLDELLYEFDQSVSTDQDAIETISWVVNACAFILENAQIESDLATLQLDASANQLVRQTTLLLLELLRPEDRHQFPLENAPIWKEDLIATLKNPEYWEDVITSDTSETLGSGTTIQHTFFSGSVGNPDNPYKRDADTEHLNKRGKTKRRRRIA